MATNPEINIVVPFGYVPSQSERERDLRFTIEECLRPQTYLHTRIILVESSENPTQEEWAAKLCAEYHFIKKEPDKPFSVGRVQNHGFIYADPRDLYYFHQADFLLPKDTVEEAVTIQREINAPFVFPYAGVANLSKEITEGLLSHKIDPQRLIEVIGGILRSRDLTIIDDPKNKANQVRLTPQQIIEVDDILPDDLQSHALLDQIDRQSKRSLNSLGNYFEEGSLEYPTQLFADFRLGPRAKASYLCLADAYAQIGGVPEFEGWGFEDLGFWAKVKTFFDYSLTEEAIYFKGNRLTKDDPLVHLWHPTQGNTDYYEGQEVNRKLYEDLINLDKNGMISRIRPLRRFRGGRIV